MAMMCWGMNTYPVYTAIPATEIKRESEAILRTTQCHGIKRTVQHANVVYHK